MTRGETRESSVGRVDDWVQSWRIPYTGSVPGIFVPTPKTGNLVISYRTADGVVKYWDGSAFVAGSEIILATTIDTIAKTSRYPFAIPAEVRDLEVTMEGWFNGDRPGTYDIVRLRIDGEMTRLDFEP